MAALARVTAEQVSIKIYPELPVMPGLDPGIYARTCRTLMDGRDKPGHDDFGTLFNQIAL